MNGRDFSDSAKLEVIKMNLENNNGEIRCATCNKKLISISECHFDHIVPYAKGGKSVVSNCQILCVDCNLRKNDKELKDFILEEHVRRFLSGEVLGAEEDPVEETQPAPSEGEMTKELFDQIVGDFIRRKGDIHKVDFTREYNHLPSIHYLRQFYGGINELKKAFGIEDLSYSWNRESIKEALLKFVAKNGDIFQKDLIKANRLPSLPCILNYYPEYSNFTEVKRGLCKLDVIEHWTVESAIKAGKAFVAIHKKITQKDLGVANHLPTTNVIYRLFGSMEQYQKTVGAELPQRHTFISEEEIAVAVDVYFDGGERVVESQKVFFEKFPYSPSTISKRYGTFDVFCKKHNIKVLNSKKAKYTKREGDDAISSWVRAGKAIPLAKDLTRVGLPSLSIILKFYEDWKEPFYLYKKIHEEANRH